MLLFRKLSSQILRSDHLVFNKNIFKSILAQNRLNSSSNHNEVLFKTLKMEKKAGKYLSDILKTLQEYAPLEYAESWDNVGLLVNPMSNEPIQNVLLTNDLTEIVVEEAIKLQTGLIITYHPNIFRGLKSVSNTSWKERIIIQCIKNKIAVYSPHTSWDNVRGGVNDWLVKAFPVKSHNIEFIKENPNYNVVGSGRIFSLDEPISVSKAVDLVKKQIGLDYVRLALGTNKTESSDINVIALCVGSGSSVLSGVKADLYVTGEMLHHDILDATQNGINVILCNHSDSERGFLKKFKTIFTSLLNNDVNVFVSEVDKDPLKTV
ncbi:NIF3-like protein 1 [Onthophagus taurus]|uniref:NIF3-like protein 1 n=1 Tax=Onthophagus taurus TaxID=166361 RepID=UPI0039BE8193